MFICDCYNIDAALSFRSYRKMGWKDLLFGLASRKIEGYGYQVWVQLALMDTAGSVISITP